MNKKMEEVKEAQVRVVSEEFLQDVQSSSKGFQELLSLHALSPWGAEVKQEHKAVPVGGKSSGQSNTKSTGKVKEEQGEKPTGLPIFLLLFLAFVTFRVDLILAAGFGVHS